MLAHIHGALDVYPSWRLTKAHYQQLLQDPAYTEALKQLFLRQVFFVGFGLQDDDLDLLLATVAEIYPAGVGEFYALLPRSRRGDQTVSHLIRENGLRPIFYDADPDPSPDDPFGGHRAAFECLADLSTAWASGQRGFRSTLKYFPELDPVLVGREQELRVLERLLVDHAGAVIQVVGIGGVGKTSLVQQLIEARSSPLSQAGYRGAVGCSFQRADVGQFVQDLAATLTGQVAAPLPELLERACEHLRRHKTLLVLDGAEVLADDDLVLNNPYLDRLFDATTRGGGAVVCTSRVRLRGPRFDDRPVLEVAALSEPAIETFLRQWGLTGLGDSARRRLGAVTAGHPLALRVLAGVLDDVPAEEAVATIERTPVLGIADDSDPLRENRLARVIRSYDDLLHADQAQLLRCLTVFDQPVSFHLLASTLTRPYPDSAANARLVGRDLRPVVVGLLDRRLMTVGAVGELSCHPTVRQYFGDAAGHEGLALAPLHRHVAGEHLAAAPDLADTFPQAETLIAGARHAAACEDWSLFDDTFRRRLMRGHLVHLCDYLGAWDETLSLARLACGSSFPAAATPDPAYYPLMAARALKHLGRSAESANAYLGGLPAAAASRDPESAMYLNNFLTLLIWRGELAAAADVAPLNLATIGWIPEDWRRRWQTEHGCSSIAYLRLLQGDLDAAQALFEQAERAWDGHDGEREWIWDYYPFHRAELILLRDPDAHVPALQAIEALLAQCIKREWPEPECRGHIHAAAVYVDRGLRARDPQDFQRAQERLDRAASITAGISVADVEIAHLLCAAKLAMARQRLGQPELAGDDLSQLAERLELLITASGLRLAEPEAVALRGVVAHRSADWALARRHLNNALAECERQSHVLAAMSPRSLVSELARDLEAPPTALLPADPQRDLLGMLGEDPEPQIVIDGLRGLRRPSGHGRG